MIPRIAIPVLAMFLAIATTSAEGPIEPDCIVHNKDGSVASRLTFESAHRRLQVEYNKDGSTKTREVQEINDTGETTKRTVFRADGTLDHAYEDYYSDRNYLSRTNCFNAKGDLDEVDIYFDDMDIVTILDGQGKFLRIESTYDPTIPAPSWATPYPGEFPDRRPTPKPPLQRFTDIHLDDSPK